MTSLQDELIKAKGAKKFQLSELEAPAQVIAKVNNTQAPILHYDPSPIPKGENRIYRYSQFSEEEINKLISGIVNGLGKARLSVNWFEVATALKAYGLITISTVVTEANIPANTTVTAVTNVQKGTVLLPLLNQINVGTDHAIALTASLDNVVLLDDPDVIAARYAQPTAYVQFNAIYPTRNNAKNVVTNTTGSTVYFSTLAVQAIISSEIFNKIMSAYFKLINEEIGISASYQAYQ